MNKYRKKMLIRYTIYFVHCLIILGLAYLLNRFFQMLMLILFFNAIQGCFNYRFHTDTIITDDPIKADNLCKLITVVVELVYLAFCKDINVSVYSNLFVIFTIASVNALLQYFLERIIIHSSALRNKDYLEYLCMEYSISTIATKRLIDHYIHKKSYKQIANEEFVEPDTVKQSIIRTKKKIHL